MRHLLTDSSTLGPNLAQLKYPYQPEKVDYRSFEDQKITRNIYKIYSERLF